MDSVIQKHVSNAFHQESNQVVLIREHVSSLESQYDDLADELSTKRQKAQSELGQNVMRHLIELGLDQAAFRIMLSRLPKTQRCTHGQEAVSFLKTIKDCLEELKYSSRPKLETILP